jgi:hypothetical protein
MSKFNAWCRISDFLEATDPEYADLLKGTCANLNLNTKGKPGLTLLIAPPGSDLRKKITKLAYSSDYKEVQQACDMLNAMILRVPLKTASDWNANSGNIPNSIFPSQHVEIVSAKGDEIKFKSGAVAELNKKFKDSSKRQNLAVWDLKSGEIPVTSDKPAKAAVKGKNGAYIGSAREAKTSDAVVAIIHQAEKEFLDLLVNPKPGRLIGNVSSMTRVGGCGPYGAYKPLNKLPRDPFLELTLSLVQFAHEKRRDELYDWIIPHISFNKVDPYLILQPYVPPSKRFLQDEFINDWINYCKDNVIKFQAAIDCVNSCLMSHHDSSWLYTDRMKIIQYVDDKRVEAIRSFSGSGTWFGILQAMYRDMHLDGDDTSKMFPEALMAHYAENPKLKMFEDEARYITTVFFNDAMKESNVEDRLQIAEHAFKWMEEKSPLNDLVILNQDLVNNQLLNAAMADKRISFIKSTYFMFIPLSSRDMKNIPYKTVCIKPNINSRAVWLMHKELDEIKKNVGERYGQGEASDTDCIQLLNGVGPDSDDALKAAVLAAALRIKGN